MCTLARQKTLVAKVDKTLNVSHWRVNSHHHRVAIGIKAGNYPDVVSQLGTSGHHLSDTTYFCGTPVAACTPFRHLFALMSAYNDAGRRARDCRNWSSATMPIRSHLADISSSVLFLDSSCRRQPLFSTFFKGRRVRSLQCILINNIITPFSVKAPRFLAP